jgi:hypothetical protein
MDMTNKLGNLKKAVFAAALLLAAVPFLAPIQAQASNVTITSGTLPIGQGARSFLVIIQGTGFETGAVATISGTRAWLKNPLAFQGTTLEAFATVAPNATSGARTLTVTNPDGSSAKCTGCVVIDPAPKVTGIDSLQTGAGQAGFFSQSVTVHGTGFVPGLGRVFVKGAGIVAWPAVAVTSSTEATVGMVVSPQASPGRYGVTFTSGDGGVGRCASCFTVVPGPRLDGMTPGSFIRGNRYVVTLSGQHFDQGAVPTVSILHGGIVVSNVSIGSAGTTLTFDMAISGKAFLNGPGIFLFVRNPAPGFGSIAPVALTVTKSCGTTTC